MTAEELKQKAAEYATSKGSTDSTYEQSLILMYYSYIDGYKQGCESQWHDLVKNPEVLPDCESVVVKTYDGEFYVACYSNGEWRFKDIQYNPVIAWKEI